MTEQSIVEQAIAIEMSVAKNRAIADLNNLIDAAKLAMLKLEKDQNPYYSFAPNAGRIDAAISEWDGLKKAAQFVTENKTSSIESATLNLMMSAAEKGYSLRVSKQGCGLWNVAGGLSDWALTREDQDGVYFCYGRPELDDCLKVVISGLDELANAQREKDKATP